MAAYEEDEDESRPVVTGWDVQQRVALVASIGDGDPEAAHWEEDVLHQAVLRAIARGTAVDAQEMATIALTTTKLDFDRWYA